MYYGYLHIPMHIIWHITCAYRACIFLTAYKHHRRLHIVLHINKVYLFYTYLHICMHMSKHIIYTYRICIYCIAYSLLHIGNMDGCIYCCIFYKHISPTVICISNCILVAYLLHIVCILNCILKMLQTVVG